MINFHQFAMQDVEGYLVQALWCLAIVEKSMRNVCNGHHAQSKRAAPNATNSM